MSRGRKKGYSHDKSTRKKISRSMRGNRNRAKSNKDNMKGSLKKKPEHIPARIVPMTYPDGKPIPDRLRKKMWEEYNKVKE